MTIQLFVGALAFLPLALASESKPAEPALPQVLVALDAQDILPLQGPIARHRTIAVRPELLADAAASGQALMLEPFPGERYELRETRVEAAYGGGQVYTSKMIDAHGKDAGLATISVYEDAISASLRLDGRSLWRIEPAGDGVHRVVELDETRMPECGTKVVHSPPATAAEAAPGGPGSTKAAPTNSPTVDVLVAYTTAAKNGQGGANAMVALVNLAVTESNQGYANSDVEQRYRLVHLVEMVGYTEVADFVTNLNRFHDNGDGFMDQVHTLRDQFGADACSLILNGTQYCGVAYGIMGAPSNGFAPNAFQVTSRTCTTGYYSFSHEFGHLFGAQHDKANAGNAFYPYAYGWRTTSGLWRTVMAYAPGTRINYWSNPNKTYQGEALGVVNQAENYRALNNNKGASSQWRCAKPVNYCVAKYTSSLKYPVMGFSGKPIANGTGNFVVSILGAEPNKSALVFYGYSTNNSPFLGGTLCVGGALTRLPGTVTDANGDASFFFSPIMSFLPGDEIYFQGWFRDPAHPDGTGSGLTDGLRADVCQYNN
jgi:peptidyl-Asp metalloendopeptidase